MLTTKSTLPRRFRSSINCAPHSAPAIVPSGHDQAEAQIDIAERAMAFRGDDRFADDVREIGADGEIPMHPDRAQRRPGDETPADAEKSAHDPDEKPDHDEINRADVRPRDREMHGEERDHSERPRMSRKMKVVTDSRTTAWPMIRPMATRA